MADSPLGTAQCPCPVRQPFRPMLNRQLASENHVRCHSFFFVRRRPHEIDKISFPSGNTCVSLSSTQPGGENESVYSAHRDAS